MYDVASRVKAVLQVRQRISMLLLIDHHPNQQSVNTYALCKYEVKFVDRRVTTYMSLSGRVLPWATEWLPQKGYQKAFLQITSTPLETCLSSSLLLCLCSSFLLNEPELTWPGVAIHLLAVIEALRRAYKVPRGTQARYRGTCQALCSCIDVRKSHLNEAGRQEPEKAR